METIFTTDYYKIGIWVILGLTFAAYIGLMILWNKKYVPYRRARGQATPQFGTATKRITDFAFKEDPRSIAPKKAPKLAKKLLTLKTINWTLLGLTLLFVGINRLDMAWIPLTVLIIVIAVQTSGPLKQRDKILQRMYAVAASSFGYGKQGELNPWAFVRIKKWEGLTQPSETHLSIPANWDASSYARRDGLEAHFNTTVTDSNSWIYEWKTADGVVIARPISHLPERADYPGSEKHPWHVIPMGVGAEGEVTVDLTSTPHMLVCGTTGSGKALALTTPVLTTKGWKTIGTIQTGDVLYRTDGKTTTITHLHPIITPQKAYKVTFKSGESITVDAEHLWETVTKKTLLSEKENHKETALVPQEKAFTILQEYYNAENEDTISIPELKHLLNLKTSSALYRVAKQVGEAELVQKTAVINYTQEPVSQKQKFVTVNKEEFISLYNNRNIIPTKTKPLTAYNYEKLAEYARETRSTDTVTLENIQEYVNATPATKKWLQKNLDLTLPAPQMLQKAVQKAEKATDLFPTKIFTLDTATEEITYEDVANIMPMVPADEVKQKFYYLTTKAQTRKIVVKETTRKFSDKPKIIQTAPVPHYPKKLILRAVLERSGYYPEAGAQLDPGAQIRSTEEILNTFTSQTHLYKGDTLHSPNHYIKTAKPLSGDPTIHLPVKPYTLGAYLGDGYTSSGRICGEDIEVFQNIQAEGYKVQNITTRSGSVKDFYEYTFVDLGKNLKDLGVSYGSRTFVHADGPVKHIPDVYLRTTEENRRQLLRGLLDTDGSVKSDGRLVFSNTNEKIIESVTTLIASLGYTVEVENGATVKSDNKRIYHVIFHASPKDELFGLTRKNIKHTQRFKGNVTDHLSTAHKIVHIEEVTPEPMRCISVDAEDRLFLVGRTLVPTHNSVLQRNLIFHCIQHNDMWRFLGVDVKRVELKPFAKYKQTVLGIGTNLEDGVEIVRYAKEVMESRYEEMEERGVNHFKDLLDENGKPPYAIMLMVDEAYMFMATEGAKTDEGKMRDQLHGDAGVMLGEIARLGRASGVHLVLATQRPDATVIKGELKANLDIRIAAGRLDATPSSMVLDSGAATQLPGHIKGRGIVRFGGHQEQFQGYFAPQEWIDQWLEQHPGVEPTVVPKKRASSPVEQDEVNTELEELASHYNFDDGKIDVQGTTVETQVTSVPEEFETTDPDMLDLSPEPVPAPVVEPTNPDKVAEDYFASLGLSDLGVTPVQEENPPAPATVTPPPVESTPTGFPSLPTVPSRPTLPSLPPRPTLNSSSNSGKPFPGLPPKP